MYVCKICHWQLSYQHGSSQQDQEVTQGGPFVVQWNPSVADNILSLKGRCP